MNEQRPFDPKMLLAILAVMALWFGWQSHLQKKYPDYYKQQAGQAPAQSESSPETTVSPGATATVEKTAAPSASASVTSGPKPEKLLQYQSENWSFAVSSKGMALKNITLEKYTDRENKPVTFEGVTSEGNFSTNILGRAQPLDFEVTNPEPNKFVGVAELGGNRIVKTIIADPATYTLQTQVRVERFDENFSGLITKFSKKVPAPKGWGIFAVPEHTELYIDHDGSYERHTFQVDEPFSQSAEQPGIVSMASQYFALAIVDGSDSRPNVVVKALPKDVNEDNKYIAADAETTLTYNVPAGAQAMAINYTAFAGPKSFDLLKSIDDRLSNVVNYGFFQTIGKLIFKLMQAIHKVTGNWGVAIILLTILVRIIVLPFNMMSYRSMKGLAKIQPQLKLIRERYAHDKVKLNEETLRLMREAKANPLGGCLPILLQFPVFLALFQVLGQSIELYKAPFGLWINDLSLRDPYFILPVLMGVTLWVQQKITPNTMDPAQQKVMMILPIFFTAMMSTLASGLTLYIFVSGLFGVLQQLYFMRDEKKRERMAEAKVLSVKTSVKS